MAGHSKWANIKHRKGAQDAKRAKIFGKLSKEIIVAAAKGDDPDSNSALRLAISKARANSMPKKNIETAIKKGRGSDGKNTFKEFVYGGNVRGISFLVYCLADNANRVSASVQNHFSKANGSISSSSSVSYIFERKGVLQVAKSLIGEEVLTLQAIEANAEDVEVTDESFFIYCQPNDFQNLKDAIDKLGIDEYLTSEITYIPNNEVKTDKDKAEKILNFIEKLEDDDDIQEVYHNLDPESLN